jgi:hypothetical protein
METMPEMLKINEKPRKYHFSLSQSTFTPRNNSTGSTLPVSNLPGSDLPGPEAVPASAFKMFSLPAGQDSL